ncbi:MAG: SDR family NAD(P)-dependent oxidoreductase [Verrucomicrobiota bacterium]
MADASDRKLAVITGGQGGLGSALAAAFSEAGYQVEAPGRDRLDVTDEAQVNAFFAGLPRLDVLVHNAGHAENVLFFKMPTESFDRMLATHLRGGFFCARAALKPMMKARRGHILMIGSRSARTGPRGQTNYAPAKAGLEGLARSLAEEYGSRGIQCNVVLPGFLAGTKMTRDLPPERLQAHLDDCVLGAFNTVENAAQFIVKIAELELVSGQTFTLDSRIDAWI